MAVKVENGVTVLTPTRWKWLVGAAGLFFIPPVGPLLSLVFVLMATGKLQRLELSQEGLRLRNWFSKKTYNWDEIGDFRLMKLKSGFITAASMVSFTHVKNEGKVWAKAAKALSGGTHSVPALGLPAKKLVTLMEAYRQGLMRNDQLIHTIIGGQAPVPAKAGASAAEAAPIAAMSSPAAGVAQPMRAQKQVPAQATPKPVFGKAAPRPAQAATFGKAAKSDPLVQDSGARRRRLGG